MKIRRLACMTVAAFLVGLAVAPSAFATTTSIRGDVHTDASWTYYSTIRETDASGYIRLDLTNCTANTLRLYLRNAAGSQISQVQVWPDSGGGYVSYVKMDGTTTYAAGTQFKFTGRLTDPIADWEDNTWAGSLSYN